MTLGFCWWLEVPLREELSCGFLAADANELLPLFREALVYDLYARENCKKRPGWACDLAPYKQEIRARNPENKGSLRHTEVFHYAFPTCDSEPINELPQRTDKPLFYLFNYEMRDPLTYQARVERI